MKLIEEFSKCMNQTFSNPALLYLLWMGLFQKGTETSFEHAARLTKECPGLYFYMRRLKVASHRMVIQPPIPTT